MSIYRGFEIYETPGQINARPLGSSNPALVPIAARTREELLHVVDFQIAEIKRKAPEREEEDRAARAQAMQNRPEYVELRDEAGRLISRTLKH